jgi:hypothetical protein
VTLQFEYNYNRKNENSGSFVTFKAFSQPHTLSHLQLEQVLLLLLLSVVLLEFATAW